MDIKDLKEEEFSGYFSEVETLRSQIATIKRENRRLMEQLRYSSQNKADVVRVVCPFVGEDSCDALYPYIQDFYIPTETTELISVRIRFRIRNFRAYSKSNQSAPQFTSSSGGGTTVTSASGGGETATSSSGGGYSSGSTNTSAGSHGTNAVAGIVVTEHSSPDGWLIADNSGQPNIQQTSVAPWNHDHTFSITIPDHSHDVTISSHTHNVTILNHQHTIESHNHDIVFGIFEQTPSSPKVLVWLSQNGVDFPIFIGESTSDGDFEIATQIKGTGWKSIKFEANELLRIVSNVIVVADLKI